jgi:putative N6-adenine-specific DNA methylase
MIKKAEKNIEISQVDVDIEVLTKDFLKSSKEDQDDLFIIINPPYDKRISADVKSLYKSIGDTLKNNYQFSDVWIITANLEAIKSIGLKTSKKIKLFNSNLESRLLNYKIYPGTKKVKN